jgi:hypothetical protein
MHNFKRALLIAGLLSFSVCAGAAAQNGPAQPVSALPSASKPDISGIWEIYPDPFGGEENTLIELPVPGDGPNLKEPFATEWKKLRADRDAKLAAGTPMVDSSTQCLPEGLPLIMGAIFPIEILQTSRQITVLAEFLTQTRRIYLDRPMRPLDEINPSYYGFSSGRWEGDILVVTTKGVKEDVHFFDIPHSPELVITERIRLTGPDLIENAITMDDPVTLKEPYRFTYGYRRNPSYEIMEYFCDPADTLTKVKSDGTVEMKTSDEFQ